MEALLAAMYEDHGLAFARAWLEPRLRPVLNFKDQYVSTGTPWRARLTTVCDQRGLDEPKLSLAREAEYRDPYSHFVTATSVSELRINNQVRRSLWI